jgi:phenylpropionate dioxygenase-like ring-hydroxylating dioxygenase large terminal subunit
MIKNQWYAVLESGEIKAGKMTGVTRLGERLCVLENQQ